MNTIDEQLQQLALEIQQCSFPDNPSTQKRRRKALTEIHELITYDKRLDSCYRGLRHQYIGDLGGQLFEECYRDALSQTWLEFIKKYNTQKAGVWFWFSQTLNYRFKDVKNDYLQIRRSHQKIFVNQSLDKPICNRNSNESEPSITYIDILSLPQDNNIFIGYAEDLLKIIQNDEYQIFNNRYLRDSPQANYQAIALARYQEKSWEEIAQEFGKNIGSITPFFTRSHDYFRPIIHELILGHFLLSEIVENLLIADKDNRFKGKKMTKKLEDKQEIMINFQEVILKKLQKRGLDWHTLAKELGMPNFTRDLIYFYLDSLSYFKPIFKQEFYL